MREQVEVIFENGVLRPLGSLPGQLREHQRLVVTIESADSADDWLADADPGVGLDAVRQALAKVPGTLAEIVAAERTER
jgi:predicted DNA-binding antitoxin AbrB/MazE fold protein